MLVRDGEEMRDPFGERRGKFQWKVLGEKLAMLRENNPQWFVEVKSLSTIISSPKRYAHYVICREMLKMLAVKIVNSATPEKSKCGKRWRTVCHIFNAFV